MDWAVEDEYWRTSYASRPYIGSNRDYHYWQPAYRYGYESAQRYQGRNWNDVENDLRSGWDSYPHRGSARGTGRRSRPRSATAGIGWSVTGSRYIVGVGAGAPPLSRRNSLGVRINASP
jgi:hypothetical protein